MGWICSGSSLDIVTKLPRANPRPMDDLLSMERRVGFSQDDLDDFLTKVDEVERELKQIKETMPRAQVTHPADGPAAGAHPLARRRQSLRRNPARRRRVRWRNREAGRARRLRRLPASMPRPPPRRRQWRTARSGSVAEVRRRKNWSAPRCCTWVPFAGTWLGGLADPPRAARAGGAGEARGARALVGAGPPVRRFHASRWRCGL